MTDFFRSEPEGDELELLASVVAGTATSTEREALASRIDADPALRKQYEQMLRMWERAPAAMQLEVTDTEIDTAWARLAADLPAATGTAPPHPQGPRWAPRRRSQAQPSVAANWQRALLAASVLLTFGLGMWLFAPFRSERFGPLQVAGEAADQFTTGPGELGRVVLSDGTRVTLAPATTLRVTTGFGATARETELQGRAYFQVSPDPDRPFLVRTSHAVARVLGTEFEVRAHDGEPTEVVVRSGRVAVGSPDASLAEATALTGGDRGLIGPERSSLRVESGVDVDQILAWTHGVLAFQAAPATEVLSQLEHWYDLRIRLADPALAERRITATFGSDPLEVTLDIVADLIGARWQRVGEEVVFSIQ
jgi:transmembrane sensor